MRQGAPAGNLNATKNKDGNNSTFVSDASLPSRDLAAAKVGISGKTVDLAEKIADKAPDLYQRIGDSPAQGKEYTVWDAQWELRRREKTEKEAEAIARAEAVPAALKLFTGDAPYPAGTGKGGAASAADSSCL